MTAPAEWCPVCGHSPVLHTDRCAFPGCPCDGMVASVDLATVHREAANVVADVFGMLTAVGQAAAHVQINPRRREAPDSGPEVNVYLTSTDPDDLRLVLAALGLDHLPVTERETISERIDGLTRTTFYEVTSPDRWSAGTYWRVWCSRSVRITDDQLAVPDA